ncbi:hypothetical protein BH11ACT8_BH11ACT8_30540 [soil metagenome]
MLDGCESGAVLYNDLTSADRDHDLVATPRDKCPSLQAARDNGCPIHRRTVRMSYHQHGKKFTGRLRAPGVSALARHQRVSIYLVRGGNNRRIAQVKTRHNGTFSVRRAHAEGRFYAKVGQVLKPAHGQAKPTQSKRVRVRS